MTETAEALEPAEAPEAVEALAGLIGQEAAHRVVAIRHALHRHPEIGMETAHCAELVEDFLKTLPIERMERFAGNGICALIRGTGGTGEGPMIGLRADNDALPIAEETCVPWKSQVPNCAHLCGHDGHTAGLLAAAKLLSERRDRFSGSVALIFQPGEEGWAGADKMIKDGLFERFPCSEVWAIHGAPGIPLGEIALRPGAMTASADIADMIVEGRGGHGARPHETIDPMPIAAELILAMQTIVSRNTNSADAAVISCCYIHAGDELAPTVIPQRVHLSATIRTHSPAVRDMIERRFGEICRGIGSAYGAEIRLDYQRRYPPQINDAALVQAAVPVLQKVFGEKGVRTDFPAGMGAEDFAFMSEKVPGVYMQLGLRDETHTAMVHNPGFDFNDLGLAYAAKAFAAIIESRLPVKG